MNIFKYFIIGILCFCNICIAQAEVITNYNNPVIYKTVLFKNGEKDANKILYEHIKKISTKESLEYWNFSEQSVCAYKVDLNNDGSKEIIGFARPLAFWSWNEGTDLFILKKIKNEYINISVSGIQFSPNRNLYILKSKTKGYNNIKFYFLRASENDFGYASFKNNSYEWNYSKMPQTPERTRNERLIK